jgi:hypothetical protein
MKIARTLAAAAAAIIALCGSMALPAAADPFDRFDRDDRFQRAFGPIHVDSVTINRRGAATDGINIVYHNERGLVARQVVFDVDYRGVERRVVDIGSFSQGAEINHTFGEFRGFGYEGPIPDRIAVVYVQFTDGSVWQR